MFRKLPEAGVDAVAVQINGRDLRVPAGVTVAAAVLANWDGPTRTTSVAGVPRAPYCMMGVCFDCLMEIDGVPNRQACMVTVEPGMCIVRQSGMREA